MENKDDSVVKNQNCTSRRLWEDLPAGPLIEIAKRLNYYEDFDAILVVCTRWYNALRESKCKFLEGRNGCSWTVPWLFLAEFQVVTQTSHPLCINSSKGKRKDQGKQQQHIRLLFYMLSSQRIRECIVKLPSPLEMDLTEDCNILSSHGWLMVVSNKGVPLMFMFSPFRSPPHNHIPLPGPLSLPELCWGALVRKFAFSNPPSKDGCSCVVAILYDKDLLAVCSPGDNVWTGVDPLPDTKGLLDITFSRGHFYVIGRGGCILRFSPDKKTTDSTIIAHNVKVSSMSKKLLKNTCSHFFMVYMVVLPCDKLLMVVRRSAYPEFVHPSYYYNPVFKVFEIVSHPEEVILKEFSNLGNASLFVGLNQSFSIEIPNDSHCYYGCKPNRIYFTDDYSVRNYNSSWDIGQDMGSFNMADGSIEQFQGPPHSFISPPLWLQPCSYAN